MKTPLILMSLAVSAILTSAADAPKKDTPPIVPDKPQDVRTPVQKKYDKNGDGQIDEAERTAYYQERRKEIEAREKERIKLYDKNGDGKLDDEERAAAREEFLKARRGSTNAPAEPPVPTKQPVKKLNVK